MVHHAINSQSGRFHLAPGDDLQSPLKMWRQKTILVPAENSASHYYWGICLESYAGITGRRPANSSDTFSEPRFPTKLYFSQSVWFFLTKIPDKRRDWTKMFLERKNSGSMHLWDLRESFQHTDFGASLAREIRPKTFSQAEYFLGTRFPGYTRICRSALECGPAQPSKFPN